MKFQNAKFARVVGTVCAASVASSLCLPAASKAATSNTAMLPSIYSLLLNSKAKQPKVKADAPNFITIVLDDMGHSDFGYLGAEIPTPNIDKLADEGIKLTSFYAAPASTPSRAMLFTGMDNHLVGFGRMRRFHHEQEDEEGYEGELPDKYPPFFKVLRDNGYYTMMTGKWDELTGEHDPQKMGWFDATRALLTPGGDVHFSYPLYDGVSGDPTAYKPPANATPDDNKPNEKGEALVNMAGIIVPNRPNTPVPLYTENGENLELVSVRVKRTKDDQGNWIYSDQQVPKFPKDFYSVDYYTEMAIEMLENRTEEEKKKPFYLNISHIAPHTPLQAPKELVERYIDPSYDPNDPYDPDDDKNDPDHPSYDPKTPKYNYAVGWDEVIKNRFNKMVQSGLLDSKDVPTDFDEFINKFRPAEIPAWNTLDEVTQQIEAKRMAIYAAMIDKIDQSIGDLLDYLDKEGELQNTVIAVFSDNGAESANAPFNASGRRNFLLDNNDMSYENMGNWNSFVGMSRGWAWVQSAPYSMYKGSTFEGGVRTASFLHYPNAMATSKGITHDDITSIMDIAPTFLEMAGLEFVPPPLADEIPEASPGDLYRPNRPSSPYSPDPFAQRRDRQHGCSMAYLLDSDSFSAGTCSQNRRIGWEIDGAKGFRWDVPEEREITVGPPARRVTHVLKKGQWKLSMTWGEGERYYFFDLTDDKFEHHELDEDYPTQYYPNDDRNEMKGRIWDAYLEYARVNNVISVGNPVIKYPDPNEYHRSVISPKTSPITGNSRITLEGMMDMSAEEAKEVLIETEPLDDPVNAVFQEKRK